MYADNVIAKIQSASANVAEEWERNVCNDFETYGITSPIEQLFYVEWQLLCSNSPLKIPLFPQRKVGNYYIDFEVDLYMHFMETSLNAKDGKNLYKIGDEVPKVAIELDGHDWHEKTKQQVARDKRRERELVKRGYKILRFSGSEVVKNPAECAIEAWNVAIPIIHELRSKYSNKGGW